MFPLPLSAQFSSPLPVLRRGGWKGTKQRNYTHYSIGFFTQLQTINTGSNKSHNSEVADHPVQSPRVKLPAKWLQSSFYDCGWRPQTSDITGKQRIPTQDLPVGDNPLFFFVKVGVRTRHTRNLWRTKSSLVPPPPGNPHHHPPPPPSHLQHSSSLS